VSTAQSAAPATTFVVTPDQATDLLIELESTAFDGRLRVDTEIEKGEVIFHQGNILKANFGTEEGRAALLCLLTAANAKWTLQPCAVDDAVPIVASVNSLLTRDEPRQLHWDELCAHAPPMGGVLRLSTAGAYVRDTSNGQQSSLLKLIDGRRTLMQVLEDSVSEPVHALEQVLVAIDRGLVHLATTTNSLFPLAATEESSGFMPRLATTSDGEGALAMMPQEAVAGDHLRRLDSTGSSLVAPIANSNSARDEPLSEPLLTQARHCIGRYEVLMRIGSGGMGTVYLSRMQSEQTGFRRLFALKLLRSHLSGDAQATREFLEEARVAGILHHTNVVGVSDAGFHGQRPYLVMDYVEGCSLRQLMKGWPGRSAYFLLPIAIDALSGLHAVHTLRDDSGVDLNLVHCDISPENIMVGVDGTCRLTDFGVTRRANYVRGSTMRGKLGYVAPERLAGLAFDHRADIFSMGVVLWNCLTGRNLLAETSVEERLDNVSSMSTLAPSELGAESSAGLDQIIMRALSRDPRARYSSAEEMLTALRDVAATGPGLATSQDVADWVREVSGHELALRRLAVLDASRSTTVPPREFPSSRWLLPGAPIADNIPILLARRTSAPPTADVASSAVPRTNQAITAAESVMASGPPIPVALPQPSALAIGARFYGMAEILNLNPELFNSPSEDGAATAGRDRHRDSRRASPVLIVGVALLVASLIGYALTDALTHQPTPTPATQPAPSK
jgi:eukaryotic-like serine/threonine-protein kinase